MIKKFQSNLNQLPSELSNAFTNRLVINIFIILLLVAISIFKLSLNIFIPCIIIAIVIIAASIIQYRIICSGKLLYLNGIVIDKNSRFNLGIGTIVINFNDNYYHVNISNRLFQKIKIDMFVSVYALPQNIFENATGEITINNAMFVLPHYQKTK